MRDKEPRWVGQPADSFFITNGPPDPLPYKLQDGGTIYNWKSPPRGGQRCELQVITDKSNAIRNFRVSKDTLGFFTLSECFETVK